MDKRDYEREISIDEWYAIEIKTIMSFMKQWQKDRATNPDHFPEKLTPGEWDEQFRTFSE